MRFLFPNPLVQWQPSICNLLNPFKPKYGFMPHCLCHLILIGWQTPPPQHWQLIDLHHTYHHYCHWYVHEYTLLTTQYFCNAYINYIYLSGCLMYYICSITNGVYVSFFLYFKSTFFIRSLPTFWSAAYSLLSYFFIIIIIIYNLVS